MESNSVKNIENSIPVTVSLPSENDVFRPQKTPIKNGLDHSSNQQQPNSCGVKETTKKVIQKSNNIENEQKSKKSEKKNWFLKRILYGYSYYVWNFFSWWAAFQFSSRLFCKILSVEHLFYSLFFLFVPHIILSVFISLSSFILVFHHDIKPFILISLSNKCFELRTTVRQVRDILLYKFCKFIANKLVTLYSLNFCNFLWSFKYPTYFSNTISVALF